MADGTPFLVPVVIDDTQDAVRPSSGALQSRSMDATARRAGTSAVFVQRVSGLLA